MQERDQRIDEKPATHRKKTQLYIGLVIGGIFLALLINMIVSISSRSSQTKGKDGGQPDSQSQVKAQDLKSLFEKDKQDVIHSTGKGEFQSRVQNGDTNKVVLGSSPTSNGDSREQTIRKSAYDQSDRSNSTSRSNSRSNSRSDSDTNSPEKMLERFHLEEQTRALRARYNSRNFEAQSSSVKSGDAFGARSSYAREAPKSNDERINEIQLKRNKLQSEISSLQQQFNSPSNSVNAKLDRASQNANLNDSPVNKALSGGDFTSKFANERLSDSEMNTLNSNVVGYAKDNLYGADVADKEKISIGTIINGITTMTSISDYQGGSLKAMITNDVFDSTNTKILAPKGSEIIIRVIKASTVNEVIQNRVAFLPSWLILPNGDKIDFSKVSGLDRMGVPAIEGDEVDYHFAAQFFGVAAYALIGTKSSYEGSGDGKESFAGNFGSGARSQASNYAAKYLQIVPTVKLHAGQPIRVIVEDEIYVKPWGNIYEDYY